MFYLDSSSLLSLGVADQGGPQTYIIAQNPAVLAQLMRENKQTTLNPSAYTTPASVFNTLAVDIDLNTLAEKSEPTIVEKNELPLRTVILPAAELLKLDPIASDKTKVENDVYVAQDSPSKIPINDSASIQQSMNPNPSEFVGSQNQDPTMHYAYHFDMNAQAQNAGMPQHFQSIPQNQQLNNNFIYSSSLQNQPFIPSNMNFFHQNASNSLPPQQQQQSDGQKSRSLERSSALGYVSRMSSLERIQNAQKAVRSNSLTRQLSAGPETYTLNSRSSSFERNNVTAMSSVVHGCRANSLERNQQIPTAGHRGGSLERNQSIASTYDLMKNRGYRGGSLERNQQAMINSSRAGSLERNQQFSMGGYRNQMKPPDAEPFQEEIYDFGGANVKSCVSIALSKSMSKGMNPSGIPSSQQLPNTQNQIPQLNQIPQSQNYHHYPLSPQQMYASQNMIYTQMHPSRIWSGGNQLQQQQNTLRNSSLPPTAQNQSSFSQGSSVKLQLPQQHQQPINVQTNPHSLTQSSASVQVCSFTKILLSLCDVFF